MVNGSPRFDKRCFCSVKRTFIRLQLRKDSAGKFIGFHGLFLRQLCFGIPQHFPKVSHTSTLFSVKGTRGLEDGRFGFRPPSDDVGRSLLRLTVELLTFSERTEFHLSLPHIVGFSRTLGGGCNVLCCDHGVKSVLTDDFHIIGQRKGTFHVLLTLVQQAHAVLRIQVTFFLRRGQQTCGLCDSRTLGFEFQETRFQTVKSLLEVLAFGLQVIAHRPCVNGVDNGKEGNKAGGSSRKRRKAFALGQGQGYG